MGTLSLCGFSGAFLETNICSWTDGFFFGILFYGILHHLSCVRYDDCSVLGNNFGELFAKGGKTTPWFDAASCCLIAQFIFTRKQFHPAAAEGAKLSTILIRPSAAGPFGGGGGGGAGTPTPSDRAGGKAQPEQGQHSPGILPARVKNPVQWKRKVVWKAISRRQMQPNTQSAAFELQIWLISNTNHKQKDEDGFVGTCGQCLAKGF